MYTNDDLTLFLKVVELGNFSNAAKQLHISDTTIGRQIKTLEESIGVSLIIRDNRRAFELTNAGQELYNEIKKDLSDIQLITESLHQRIQEKFNIKAEPNGRLRIVLPPNLGYDVITEKLPQFLKKYPKINLSITYYNKADKFDKFDEGVDYAISSVLPTQPNYKIKHVVTIKHKLYCTKKYAEMYGVPKTLEEISLHIIVGSNLLLNTSDNSSIKALTATHEESHAEQVIPVPERLITNTILQNHQFILSNNAIGILTKYGAQSLERYTELVPILPEYFFQEFKFYSIRHQYSNDVAVKMFANFIETIFNEHDCP